MISKTILKFNQKIGLIIKRNKNYESEISFLKMNLKKEEELRTQESLQNKKIVEIMKKEKEDLIEEIEKKRSDLLKEYHQFQS